MPADLLSHTRVARAPSPAKTAQFARDPHFGKGSGELVRPSLTRNPAAVICGMEMAGEGAARLSSLMSTSAPTKYCYRRRLPHLQKADAALFVTFCTGAHLILPDQARDLVFDIVCGRAAFGHSRARASAPHCRREFVCTQP